ncbi:hypothetical protein BC937DRAFT_93608 [Endogone sp. FLAS-F59071]|nr:hypothetical protein BC937DRAFT_93608 [Endogone sp. FLAS-F59071]|eukprot:RUS23022.1 hypothetical protein BC937DRAFT_93608 [Endogone sp. FLAS-F59071]
MMELGATVCTPQNPKCEVCPITERCRAFEEVRAHAELKKSTLSNGRVKTGDAKRSRKIDGLEECEICLPFNPIDEEPYSVMRYPLKAVKKPPKNEECAVCILERSWTDEDGKDVSEFLLAKRPEEGLLAGLWEFPSVELGAPMSMVAAAAADSKISSRKDDNNNDDEGFDPDAKFAPCRSTGKSKSKPVGTSPAAATYQDRSRRMDAYLRDNFGLVLDEEANIEERTIRRVDLGNVVHLFSHIRKVYHVEWVLVQGWRRENEDSFTKSPQKITGIPTAIPYTSPQWMWIKPADLATAAIPTGLKKAFKVLERHRTKESDKNRGENSKAGSKTGRSKKTGGKTVEQEKGVRDISQFFVKKT